MAQNPFRSLAGSVVLVTGAGAGIGRAIAQAFAAQGAQLALADIDRNAAEETAALLPHPALVLTCDVGDSGAVRAMVAATVTRYSRLDAAVNNAGIDIPHVPLADIGEGDWARVQAVNLTGVFLCMKYEIPHMVRAGRGAIVNIASAAGLIGVRGGAAYVAAKHGVVGLTKTAALDYGHQGVRVNAICPGLVRTPLVERVLGPGADEIVAAKIPRGTMGTPEEIADVALWLCSDAASYISGVALLADSAAVAGV